MSQAEHPDRQRPDHDVTLDDVRQLMGASTPHFALQLRNRIAKLIRDLPADHPARIEGEREIARLTRLGFDGEVRGRSAEPGMATLPSVTGQGEPAAPGAHDPSLPQPAFTCSASRSPRETRPTYIRPPPPHPPRASPTPCWPHHVRPPCPPPPPPPISW